MDFPAAAALNIHVVVTLLCWGVWGILDKKALQFGSYIDVLFRFYLLSLVAIPGCAVLLAVFEPGWSIPPETWMWTFFGVLLQLMAIAAYLAAMSMTDASYVLGITAAYPVVLQVLAVPLLGESLVGERLAGAAAIAIGVAAIGGSPERTSSFPQGRRGLKLALCLVLATLGWGVWGVFDKKALAYSTPLEVYLAERIWELGVLPGLWLILKFKGIEFELRNLKTWFYVGLSTFSLAVGRWTFLSALALSSASYVITITGCYPLIMYFLALAFLKERFNKLRFAGIWLIVLGGITVQMTGD